MLSEVEVSPEPLCVCVCVCVGERREGQCLFWLLVPFHGFWFIQFCAYCGGKSDKS